MNAKATRQRPGRPTGSKSTTTEGMGAIRPEAVYPLPVFCRLLGLGSRGWRSLRTAGLPTRRFGKRAFVLGRDALEWFAALPIDQG
ncbi:MAG: hypothetical protein RBS80_27655 [Thermoguttaceae bacterium]|nr:hypothetical protein [Thermoguttaceae bacterium]